MELSKGSNGKNLVKKMFKDLPDNPAVLEARMFDMYQTLKDHYIPLIYELKNDKTLLK